MLSLYRSKRSVLLCPKHDRIMGVKIQKTDLPSSFPIGRYRSLWSPYNFEKSKGSIDIKIDNEIFFYIEKEKTLYIKDEDASLTIINLSNGSFKNIPYPTNDLIPFLKLNSIKDTIIKLKFK